MSLFKPWTWFGKIEQFIRDPNTMLGSFVNQYTRQHLTGAENEQNAFNAQQAQNQMNFQAEMSNTAYQRQVTDMQAAGVNPALLYGSGSNGASSPSGASSQGSAFSGLGMSDLLAALRTRAEIKNIEADTKQKEADTKQKEVVTVGQDLQNKIIEKFGENEAQAKIDNLNAQTRELFSRMSYESAQAALAAAQKILVANQAKGVEFENTVKQWEHEFINKFGMTSELAGDLAGAVAGLGSSLANIFLAKWSKGFGTITHTITRGPKGVTTSTTTHGPIKAGGR